VQIKGEKIDMKTINMCGRKGSCCPVATINKKGTEVTISEFGESVTLSVGQVARLYEELVDNNYIKPTKTCNHAVCDGSCNKHVGEKGKGCSC